MLKQYETAYQKTEKALYNYKNFRDAVDIAEDKQKVIITQSFLKLVDRALDTIKDDPYYLIIKMLYIDGETVGAAADRLLCDEKTITRNKKRLIEILKVKLFSDKYITELLLDM